MRSFRSRYVPTGEGHRTTNFEIFFDLVFVFALTRIIEFMAEPPTAVAMGRGLLLLLLLWFSWSSYAWLGNEVRADVGVVRTGTLVAMAAMFLAALVIPDSWEPVDLHDGVPAPLVLALSYMTVRIVHTLLYLYVSTSPQLTRTLRLSAVPSALGLLTFAAGTLVEGTTRTVLWALAFVIDVGGSRIASQFSPWQLRSTSHFTERHRLVLIIAIGESLISVGAGAGAGMTRWSVLVGALLGFGAAVCLWRLYFDRIAPAAERVFAEAPAPRRGTIASDAYSLTHLPLIAGIIYVALGIEQVFATQIGREPGGEHGALALPAVTALYGGAALYLAGRALFLRLTTRQATVAPLAGAAVLLLLLPVARLLPALVALALLVVALTAQCAVENRWSGGRDPGPSG